MPISGVITSQSGARQFGGEKLHNYALFVSGVNATHHVLKQYSPMLNGFGRLFMVRAPYAIQRMFAGESISNLYHPQNQFNQFKHMTEYMTRSVTGFGDKNIDAANTKIQGGFAGRFFNTPTVTKETTEQITIGMYEMTGAPVYTVINGWMNAIGDENSGLATYGGFISGGNNGTDEVRMYVPYDGADPTGIAFNEANHTAEFIYVMHDRAGAQVERAVLLAGCYPAGIQQSPILDMAEGGAHDNVAYNIQFKCTVYSSPIINAIADSLLKQYRVVSNHLNFNPELGDAIYGDGDPSLFSRSLGGVPTDSATGANVGNLPMFDATTAPTTRTASVGRADGYGHIESDMDYARIAGQPGTEAYSSFEQGFADGKDGYVYSGDPVT